MKKYEINIKHEIAIPEADFAEIKNKIANTDVQKIGNEVLTILEVSNAIAEEKQKLKDKLDEMLATLNEYQGQIDEYIAKELKPHLLKYAEETKVTKVKEKMDKDGTIYKVEEVVYKLPKGFSYTKGRTGYEIDETKIPGKYFKKTIKKAEVTKAYKEGIITEGVTEVVGDPSITLTAENIKKGLDKK